jgi:hypothetical protein
MGNVVNKRRQKKITFKSILFFTILFLSIVSIVVTIFYTIPQLTRYVTRKWYISPLASGVLPYESGKNSFTQAQIKTKLSKAGFQIKKIDENEGSFIIIFETEEKVILSKKKSLDLQIASLQRISSRFTIEGKHFVLLDLRFDRPVLIAK